MVAEPWLLKMGNQVTTNLKQNKNPKPKQPKQTVGILSFEVANVMSKTIHLHNSLSEKNITKLKNEILKSDGVKHLVSDDESYLMEVVLSEKMDDLGRVAAVVARLGRKCTVPALVGFEHVYGDVVSGVIDVRELGFLVKDMDGMVRRMERYVNSTASLYSEMEVLSELEQATVKFRNSQHEESKKAFEQKLVWQKQDVRHLKDVSIWNQTFDKVVELLARTVCTIYGRICLIFGDAKFHSCVNLATNVKEESTRLGSMKSNGYRHSGSMEKREMSFKAQATTPQRGEVSLFQPEDFNFPCVVGPGRLLMECLSLSGSTASKVDDEEGGVGYDDRSSQISGGCSVASGVKRAHPNHLSCCNRSQIFSGEQRQHMSSVTNSSRFGPKSKLMVYAPPNTVGGSALALHYANVIIVIEKLLRYPHLVGEEARDDLYQMLPTSLRLSLKTNLKSYVKDLAIYDAPLAHDWKERLDGILRWLAPLAHNMIRWQSERNFEQQQIVTRTNVLLLETLYFADRSKTEAAICELLVGLNYICRYEHQQNALLDCASSFDFDDCVEWHLHY